MYLQAITIENFRCFGNAQTILFNPGLNVLVGENDSGKSAIIDAVRIVLGTTDQNWYHIEPTDFYKENQTLEIKIVLKFIDLSTDEQATFLECLTYEQKDTVSTTCLYLHWSCKYLLPFIPPRVSINSSTGKNGDGPTLPNMARELLRVTYLQPLRDAYRNMQAGRHSRLSQIIQGIPNVNAGVSQATSGMKLEDFNKLSLTGIADLSNKLLSEHSGIKNIVTEINSAMTSKLLLKGDNVKTNIEVSGTDASEERKINALLEKLDLTATTVDKAGHVGLGTSNLLSMACELLLNKNPGSFLLLIEEPEAHIHPQRQIRLIKTLQQDSANPATHQQIIITTHSNILASVVKLENIIIVQKEKAFSLQPEFTKLAKDDYAYLERFLDATKANLFFARAVMIVEGTAEELLLPTLAHLLGKDFAEYGVSTVNVGAIGLNRYARIFQRKDESNLLEVKVACVTDRDVMPNCAPSICLNDSYCDKSKWPLENKRRWKVESDFLQPGEAETYLNKIKERADGQNVKTFIADNWTLEYDLAFSGLQEEMMQAIANVKFGEDSSESKLKEIREEYNKKQTPEERASYLYSFFSKNKVSKACAAQELAAILESKYKNNDDELKKLLPVYLVNAINYVTESDDDA